MILSEQNHQSAKKYPHKLKPTEKIDPIVRPPSFSAHYQSVQSDSRKTPELFQSLEQDYMFDISNYSQVKQILQGIDPSNYFTNNASTPADKLTNYKRSKNVSGLKTGEKDNLLFFYEKELTEELNFHVMNFIKDISSEIEKSPHLKQFQRFMKECDKIEQLSYKVKNSSKQEKRREYYQIQELEKNLVQKEVQVLKLKQQIDCLENGIKVNLKENNHKDELETKMRDTVHKYELLSLRSKELLCQNEALQSIIEQLKLKNKLDIEELKNKNKLDLTPIQQDNDKLIYIQEKNFEINSLVEQLKHSQKDNKKMLFELERVQSKQLKSEDTIIQLSNKVSRLIQYETETANTRSQLESAQRKLLHAENQLNKQVQQTNAVYHYKKEKTALSVGKGDREAALSFSDFQGRMNKIRIVTNISNIMTEEDLDLKELPRTMKSFQTQTRYAMSGSQKENTYGEINQMYGTGKKFKK